MIIATHGIIANSGGITYDTDAQAFFTASGVSNLTQKNAVNQLVLDLKSYGIWTKMKALYPFVGGTATTHKFNLKDPRDLDAAFRLTFVGGMTHNSNGIVPDGATAYAKTNLIPSSVFGNTNIHMSFYSRSSTNAGLTDIGAYWTNGTNVGVNVLRCSNPSTSQTIGYIANDDPYRIAYNQTDASGMFVLSRIANNSLKLYQNNSLKQTNTTVNSSTFNNLSQIDLTISAMHYKDSATEFYSSFSDRRSSFVSIGDGLNDTESSNLYTAVQSFQTTLGRNI